MRFGLLGELTVSEGAADGGGAAPAGPARARAAHDPQVGSAKVRGLLATLLASPGRAVPLEALKDSLWGGRPPATANASLHNHVARLRRLLGEEGPARLRAAPPGYLLQVADHELDSLVLAAHHAAARTAHRAADWPRVLRECGAALALWRGEPLADVPLLSDGLRAYAAHLAELRLQVLEWRFDAELALGRHGGLAAELAALAAAHPLRESFHRQLMLALHRTHRQADALAAFHRLRRTLVDELGVEPGAAVQAAYREVLGGGCGGDAGEAVAPPEAVPAAGERDPDPGPGPASASASGAEAASGPVSEPGPGRDGATADDAAAGLEPPTAQEPPAPEPRPAPAQLPADVPDFTGRAEAVALLVAALGMPAGAAQAAGAPAGPGHAAPGRPGADEPADAPAGPGSPGRPAVAAGPVRPEPAGAAPEAQAAPGGRRVVVVSGMGGVGKTALAVRVGHLVREWFPDGQLYADLRGFGAGDARRPGDLLARFLGDLGVDGQRLPEHPDDRAGLLRDALDGRRVLLVLDNAADAAQVVPLLPGGGGSAVIVTSRRTLADLPGALRLPLEPLSDGEQRELLAAVCGAQRVADEPQAARSVLAACGGLPLALRIAGARLATRPAWPLAALSERLSTADGRLRALAAGGTAVQDTFAMSYVAMRDSRVPQEQAAARAFRTLGLWPAHPLGPGAAAALLGGTPVAAAEDALETLVDAHLLQTPRPGRYAFHDLLGEYAAGRAAEEVEPAERAAALRRLVVWYAAATAATAAVLVPEGHPIPPLQERPAAPVPSFADEGEAMRWCAAELPAVKAAVRLARARRWPDAAWRLAAALFGYAQVYWWNGEWEACLREAMACVQENGDVLGRAWTHSRLGVACGMTHRYEECGRHLAAAQRYFEEVGDRLGQAAMLTNLTSLHRGMGAYDRALECGLRSLALHRELGEPPGTILGNLGDTYLGTGDFAAAERCYRQALSIWRAGCVESSAARALTGLGESLRALGRHGEAVAALHETLRLLAKLGDRASTADVLEILGRTHLETGDRATARECWEEGLRVARDHALGDDERALLADLAGLPPAP